MNSNPSDDDAFFSRDFPFYCNIIRDLKFIDNYNILTTESVNTLVTTRNRINWKLQIRRGSKYSIPSTTLIEMSVYSNTITHDTAPAAGLPGWSEVRTIVSHSSVLYMVVFTVRARAHTGHTDASLIGRTPRKCCVIYIYQPGPGS